MLRIAFAILWAMMTALVAVPAMAQSTPDRAATGGAQTLEDILARQAHQKLDDSFRRDNTGDPAAAADPSAQLGTLGGRSDPDVWRALRYGSADVRVSAGGPVASVLIQDGGMAWLSFRAGPLRQYGGWLLGGTVLALLAFYLLRGRIAVDGALTGRIVIRFKAIERFAHWMLAGSFILLGVTGLFTLFGRVGLMPFLGKEANSWLLICGKWVHNNVAWAFVLALVMIFVMWVGHNIPSRSDLVWIRQFGGLLGSK